MCRTHIPTLLYIQPHLAVHFYDLLTISTKSSLLEDHTNGILSNLDQWFVCYKGLLPELKKKSPCTKVGFRNVKKLGAEDDF